MSNYCWQPSESILNSSVQHCKQKKKVYAVSWKIDFCWELYFPSHCSAMVVSEAKKENFNFRLCYYSYSQTEYHTTLSSLLHEWHMNLKKQDFVCLRLHGDCDSLTFTVYVNDVEQNSVQKKTPLSLVRASFFVDVDPNSGLLWRNVLTHCRLGTEESMLTLLTLFRSHY